MPPGRAESHPHSARLSFLFCRELACARRVERSSWRLHDLAAPVRRKGIAHRKETLMRASKEDARGSTLKRRLLAGAFAAAFVLGVAPGLALASEGGADQLAVGIVAQEVAEGSIVQIGEGDTAVGYESLQAAFDAAQDGDVIKVLDNITADTTNTPNEFLVNTGKKITLDLNGKDLVYTKTSADNNENFSLFNISDETELTIRDIQAEGSDEAKVGKIKLSTTYSGVRSVTVRVAGLTGKCTLKLLSGILESDVTDSRTTANIVSSSSKTVNANAQFIMGEEGVENSKASVIAAGARIKNCVTTCNVTVNSGSIVPAEGFTCKALNYSNNTIVNGGNLSAITECQKDLIVNGGTIEYITSSVDQGSSIVINGGSIVPDDGKAPIRNALTNTDPYITVNGGSFKSLPIVTDASGKPSDKVKFAEGAVLAKGSGEDALYELVDSLQAAIDAKAAEIALVQDVDAAVNVESGGNVFVSFSWNKIAVANDAAAAFSVQEGGILTLSEGTVAVAVGQAGLELKDGAEAHLKDVTFEAAGEGTFVPIAIAGKINQPLSTKLYVDGADAGITGAPAGIEVDVDTGLVSGTPTQAGEFTATAGAYTIVFSIAADTADLEAAQAALAAYETAKQEADDAKADADAAKAAAAAETDPAKKAELAAAAAAAAATAAQKAEEAAAAADAAVAAAAKAQETATANGVSADDVAAIVAAAGDAKTSADAAKAAADAAKAAADTAAADAKAAAEKAAQPQPTQQKISGKAKVTKKIKAKKGKFAKKTTVNLKKVAKVKAETALSFKKVGKVGGKKIKVAKNGKVTIAKGLKAKTYKVKVEVTAQATSKYKAASKTIMLVVKK